MDVLTELLRELVRRGENKGGDVAPLAFTAAELRFLLALVDERIRAAAAEDPPLARAAGVALRDKLAAALVELGRHK